VDTLTHALSGALAARASAPAAAAPHALRRRVGAGFLACAFPDLDFVAGLAGVTPLLLHHRGLTHSVLLAPAWALALAWVLAKLLREPAGWRALYAPSLLGLIVHIAGDWITSYGTMVLAPLSDWRAGLGVTFIIDLRFTGIVVAGLVASALWPRSRLPAAIGCAGLVAYVGWQWTLKQEALEFARAYARAAGVFDARIEAYPRPPSPWHWTVVVSDAREHRFAHVHLRRTVPREIRESDGFLAALDAPYLPLAQARWELRSRDGGALGREAWESPALAFFRWFADAPFFDGYTEGSTCAWFADLRFLVPGRGTMPFRFGACRERPGEPWRAYRRVGETGRSPLD
jgi:inner membrane protein